MQRLRGSDAYTIYSETPDSPFVTLKVAIYRPTDENDVPDIDEVKGFVMAGVGSAGVKRADLRILRVPFDLHHPVWVADPDYCPDNHIREAELPPPGNKAQLCDFLSDLMGKPLDPDRPPWEVWLLSGLENRRVAIVFKIHHALADGKRVAALIEKAHGARTGEEVTTATFEGEAIPGRLRLVADALVDLLKSYTIEFPQYYRHLKQARQGSAALKKSKEDVVAPFSAPFTILNEKGGPGRIYRYETFSLAEFRALSKFYGCSINALVMGICSEVLKRYLLELDSLPEESLTAVIPIGIQEESALKTLLKSDIHNNHLAVAISPLYQNIEDMGERLQAIHRASRAAIDHVLQSNGRRFDNYLDFMPGTFFRLLNLKMARRQAKRMSPFSNLSISNVPGPREALYALDGRLEMVELLSCGNLAETVNLNITVWSYVDNLCFSFFIREGALPEPETLLRLLKDVVQELR